MAPCQSLPFTASCLLKKMKRTSHWQPKQRRSLKPFEWTQCESLCSCQSVQCRGQTSRISYPTTPPQEEQMKQWQKQETAAREAPSRAFPRHTSKMGHSWCQPTLLCMLKSDVCQQSSFSAWGAALHIQIAPTPEQIWTSLNNQRLLILCVTNVQAPSMEPRVRTTTAPYCFNWPWRMFTQCNNPTALLAAFGAGLWWHPHKCRSKSRSRAAWLWGGEARDIRWRPLRNLKRMTSLQETGKW